MELESNDCLSKLVFGVVSFLRLVLFACCGCGLWVQGVLALFFPAFLLLLLCSAFGFYMIFKKGCCCAMCLDLYLNF